MNQKINEYYLEQNKRLNKWIIDNKLKYTQALLENLQL